MKLMQTLAAAAIAFTLAASAAEAYPHNWPAPHGGPGAHWRAPPGPFYRHGWGYRPPAYWHRPYYWRHPYYWGWRRTYWGGRVFYWWPERACWYDPFYDYPPGPLLGPDASFLICSW
jgi:hypothetical protein